MPAPPTRRAPHAFGRKKELSASEGGLILVAEYLEAAPPLLNRPGMGAKMVTYYRKRDATDSEHQRLRGGRRRLSCVAWWLCVCVCSHVCAVWWWWWCVCAG